MYYSIITIPPKIIKKKKIWRTEAGKILSIDYKNNAIVRIAS
jgi:hypothetical protein